MTSIRLTILTLILSVTFLRGQTIPSSAQTDSTRSTNTSNKRQFDAYLFGGLGGSEVTMQNGFGGTELKGGFASGLSFTAHYKFHSFGLYSFFVNKKEPIWTHDLIPTLTSSNAALTYGVGIYENYFSAAIVAGVGYTSTWMKFRTPDLYVQQLGIYTTNQYQIPMAVIGAQASVHGRVFGFGVKGFYNISDKVSNYFILAGLEIRLTGGVD